MDEHARPLVVVGVDGSRDADAAVRHAVEEARRRGGRVLAIAACSVPVLGAIDVESLPVNPEEAREATERRAREQTDEVLSGIDEASEVPLEVRAELARPVPLLVEAARDAALLVVGHRGRGPIRTALLGSVGLGCVLHAPCAVTVVRATPAAGAPATSDAGALAASR